MRRREFLGVLGGAAATWPLAARAQQAGSPVIGFVNGSVAETMGPALAAFRRSLNTAGFVEGRNVSIEFRWGEGDYRRLPAMMDDLVARQVAVIVAGGNAGVYAARATKMTFGFLKRNGSTRDGPGVVP
jgi:putative ABC transport system substrate-binding protein